MKHKPTGLTVFILQWGHGTGAVENTTGLAMVAESLRLLQWGHGTGAVENTVQVYHHGGLLEVLQWGHGTGAVENTALLPSTLAIPRLQWGHGTGAVENARCGNRRDRDAYELQWGHGTGAVENAAGRDHADHVAQASMGPRHWSRGKPCRLRRRPHRPAPASMGPRHWSRGKRPCPADGEHGSQCFNGATALEPWKTLTVITCRVLAFWMWSRERRPGALHLPRVANWRDSPSAEPPKTWAQRGASPRQKNK